MNFRPTTWMLALGAGVLGGLYALTSKAPETMRIKTLPGDAGAPPQAEELGVLTVLFTPRGDDARTADVEFLVPPGYEEEVRKDVALDCPGLTMAQALRTRRMPIVWLSQDQTYGVVRVIEAGCPWPVGLAIQARRKGH